MKELDTTEIKQIELEINFYKEQTARNIIEIGKRLIKAKEMLPHGEWGRWLDEKVAFHQDTAIKYMRVAREFSNSDANLNLSQTKIFYLLSLPTEERESFIEENPVEDMTTRELRQAIKEKKELEQQIQDLQNVPVETITVEKEIKVVPDDYQYFKDKYYENSTLLRMAEEKTSVLNRKIQDKDLELEKATKEKDILERKAKLNENEAKKYNNLTRDIENLTREKDDIGRQINAKTELSGLVVRIEHILKTELAPVKYSRAINEVSTDIIIVRNLRDIVGRVQDWCDEMYKYLPMESQGQIIELEVLENE